MPGLVSSPQLELWESQDFSITKIVIEEGGGDGGHPDGEMVTPRFGAVCSVQGEHMHMGLWARAIGLFKYIVHEMGSFCHFTSDNI